MTTQAQNQFPPWPAADPAASTDPIDRAFAHMERMRGSMLRARDDRDHDRDRRQVADELVTESLILIEKGETDKAISKLQRAHEELRS